jgi:hypothetical protein
MVSVEVGAAVAEIQRAWGLALDGVRGPQTTRAAELSASGGLPDTIRASFGALPRLVEVVDTLTGGALSDAIRTGRSAPPRPSLPVVRYGPGRGHFRGDHWLVTRAALGPGGGSQIPAHPTAPTLHCSSCTNLLIGIMTAADGEYTHAGNMASLDVLCTLRGEGRVKVSKSGQPERWAAFNGYGAHCGRLAPDGSTTAQWSLRSRRARMCYLDAEEIWRRRAELPALSVFGQSTLTRKGWKYEHHTGALIRHPDRPDVLFRVAADGSRTGTRYSGTPMDVEVIDRGESLKLEGSRLYFVHRVWTVGAPSVYPVKLEGE